MTIKLIDQISRYRWSRQAFLVRQLKNESGVEVNGNTWKVTHICKCLNMVRYEWRDDPEYNHKNFINGIYNINVKCLTN